MRSETDKKHKRKQAVQLVLDRNAQIIHALHGTVVRRYSVDVSSMTSQTIHKLCWGPQLTLHVVCVAALQTNRVDPEPSTVEVALAQEATQNMVSLALYYTPNVGST